jgi:hypothetical protein
MNSDDINPIAPDLEEPEGQKQNAPDQPQIQRLLRLCTTCAIIPCVVKAFKFLYLSDTAPSVGFGFIISGCVLMMLITIPTTKTKDAIKSKRLPKLSPNKRYTYW